MSNFFVKPVKYLKGSFTPPPDKSITHRALILGMLAKGTTTIYNASLCQDCLSTLNAIESLGVRVQRKEPLLVEGGRICEPDNVIDVGNSGTTLRLLAGALSAHPIYVTFTGDSSLRRRPMDRIILPLRKMGAQLFARNSDKYPPLTLIGNRELTGIEYELPVASAQVKSALLLAGMQAQGKTTVIEPIPTRDHTERLLGQFGCEVLRTNTQISVNKLEQLQPAAIFVGGDFSCAAYFIVAASMIKGSQITINQVNLNPTRSKLLDILKTMGAKFEIFNVKEISNEPVGDIRVVYSPHLRGIKISGNLIPLLIDELPLLAVLGHFVQGAIQVKDAKELRYKESDRIKQIISQLKLLGSDCEEFEDGFLVEGKGRKFFSAKVDCGRDHRIAMALSIAALASEDGLQITDADCVSVSFPNFFQVLESLSVR